MDEAILALTRTNIEGVLAVVAAFVLFPGTVFLMLSAFFGWRMGYLVAATGFFAWMVILSALWTFGAPGTPRYLGPKGELAAWVGVGAGREITSPTFPVLDRYPGGPWRSPEEDRSLTAEVEAATLAFQEFLADEAGGQLREQGIQGEVAPEDFEITQLEFAESEDTNLAAARAFFTGGGPEVTVFGYKDPGNEPLPSWLFLGASVIGLVAHLPFLDRAERRRKEFLTGGAQAPWRGPA